MSRRPGVPFAEKAAQLTRDRPLGYDAERMAFLFTMMRGIEVVDCEISSVALDDLDGVKGTRPIEREAQFMRLRDVVERLASSVVEQQGRNEGGRVRIFSKHIR